MNMCFSNHLSAKSHSISNRKSIAKVDKHNNRKYKTKDSNIISDEYDCIDNIQLVGSNNLLSDIQKIYDQNVDINFVEQYNEKQIKNRNYSRVIKKWKGSQALGYFKHIEENDKQNIAEEIVLKIGDFENWKTLRTAKNTRQIQTAFGDVYKDYLDAFSEEFPNFKIAQATLHFDEMAPNLHIVGCPFENGKIAKSKVFNRDNLSQSMQTNLRSVVQQSLTKNFGDYFEVAEKKQGRNLTLPRTKEYLKYKNDMDDIKLKVSSNRKEIAEAELIKKEIENSVTNSLSVLEKLNRQVEQNKQYLDLYNDEEIAEAVEQNRLEKSKKMHAKQNQNIEQIQLEKTYSKSY